MCKGELLSQFGDLVGAMSCFKKASKLDPRSPLPYLNAARTYQQVGQISTSKLHIEKALSIDPNLAMAHIDMSQLLMQSGKNDEAISTLEKALELSRHMSEIKDVLIARKMAEAQVILEEEGIFSPRVNSF